MIPDANYTAVSETTKGLQQFLYDSVVEQCPDFPDVANVDCPSITVSLLLRQPDDGGNDGTSGGGGSSVNGGNSTTGGRVETSQKSRTLGSGGIVGIVVAGMVVVALLIMFIIQRKRKSEETSSLQHMKLVDDEDPKERNMYLEDMEIATNSIQSDSPARYGHNVSGDSSSPHGLRVMVVNENEEDESLPSGNWEITQVPRYQSSLEPPPDTARVVPLSQTSYTNQDVHQCNSATCTICVERRRLEAIGGIGGEDDILVSPEEESITSSHARKPWRDALEVQFIPAAFGSTPQPRKTGIPKSPKRRSVLPKTKQDDQREYYADDTVDL
jgi:hypothetical protein